MKTSIKQKIAIGASAALIALSGCYALSRTAGKQPQYKRAEVKEEQIASSSFDMSPISDSIFGNDEYFFVEPVADVHLMEHEDYDTIVKKLNHAIDAAIYCRQMLRPVGPKNEMGKDDWNVSFNKIQRTKIADTKRAAIAAAAILSDNGYPPYILSIDTDGWATSSNYYVFLFKDKEGQFGSIGLNKWDVQPPENNTLDELVKKIVPPQYVKSYEVYDLRKLNPDFISGNSYTAKLMVKIFGAELTLKF